MRCLLVYSQQFAEISLNSSPAPLLIPAPNSSWLSITHKIAAGAFHLIVQVTD